MTLQRACAEGDRRACDSLEFEGVPPPAARRATAAPTTGELAWALLPLLLLAAASRLWSRGRRGRPHADGGAGLNVEVLRSRRLTALGSSDRPQRQPPQQQQQQPPPLPPHPAAAARGAPAGGAAAPAAPRGRQLLAAADSAVSNLLVLPLSLLQHAKHLASAGRAAAGAAAGAPVPRTPEAAPVSPATQHAGGSTGGRIYGLAIGEAESESDEWEEGGESELTQACLRRLQQSPEFKAHLKARGLSTRDVGERARRLHLYRRLRRVDPAAFWALLAPGSRTFFDSRTPSRLVLAADYLLSQAANLALAAAAASLFGSAALAALPLAARCAAAAAPLCLAAAQWARARPTAGALFALWYEEPRWGHAAPAWRCAAANAVEVAYILGSAGLGLLISLCLRCLSSRRQSVGELLAAVHPAQEVAVEAARGSDDD